MCWRPASFLDCIASFAWDPDTQEWSIWTSDPKPITLFRLLCPVQLDNCPASVSDLPSSCVSPNCEFHFLFGAVGRFYSQLGDSTKHFGFLSLNQLHCKLKKANTFNSFNPGLEILESSSLPRMASCCPPPKILSTQWVHCTTASRPWWGSYRSNNLHVGGYFGVPAKNQRGLQPVPLHHFPPLSHSPARWISVFVAPSLATRYGPTDPQGRREKLIPASCHSIPTFVMSHESHPYKKSISKNNFKI